MATLPAQLVPIQITPGVQPNTDRTPLNTPHYTMSDKVRFWRGVPQKIGGWAAYMFQAGNTIQGIARTLYSAVINNITTSIVGTDTNLYALYGQDLTNISPIDSVTHAIPNSISTDFGTLAANPITTTIGTGNIAVTDTHASKYRPGDHYTLSGATTTNGILNTALNLQQTVISTSTNIVNIMVGGTASSSGSGGGASVVRATGLLTFAATAHGQTEGDRTSITGAANTGGILAADINDEFVIRNVTTNTFDVMTASTATSSVTAAGGAGTTYQKQIPAGGSDASSGIGYGVDFYGTGLYGTARVSPTGITFPRIWFPDRFGDRIVATPGNQSGIYLWDGSTILAPTLLTNAPTDVNYLFVSDNILVTFGHQNVSNQIFASDQGDATIWTSSSENQVYQDVIEGADRFLSSVPVLGLNLIFTPSQTYTFQYIGLPDIWATKLLDNSVGIIGPMARCSVNNVAYWMAPNNFYMWSGSNVQQIQANTQDECTFLKYVYGNINNSQTYKCFAWYNDIFNEVWFHYPSANSNECDRVARVSLSDNTWSPDTFDRTCAEYPDNLFLNPRLIDAEGMLYTHETGSNANGAPMPFSLTSNLRSGGKETVLLSGFIPDSLQTGNINLNIKSQLWPQASTPTFNKDYTVALDAGRIDIQNGGRYWTETWSGSDLNQSWIMGSWYELIQKSAPN